MGGNIVCDAARSPGALVEGHGLLLLELLSFAAFFSGACVNNSCGNWKESSNCGRLSCLQNWL
jgi:hypothetical protein